MHGGAVTLARRFLESGLLPDTIIATDMLDLTCFLALTREITSQIPSVLYFHENQLTYPWAPADMDMAKGRDGHYSFINYSSALVANKVFFNSEFNMSSFFNELENFLKQFPDNNELSSIDDIRSKSSVLHIGMDFTRFDTAKVQNQVHNERPLILWNHRWEHDKNPQAFFEALYQLQEKGLPFDVAILGERFRQSPEEFDQARERLGERVVHFGYIESFDDYIGWLWKSDILPVTSNHDFFGVSVLEALYCGCYPILPKRLVYPEHVPTCNEKNYYSNYSELSERLEFAVMNFESIRMHKFQKYSEQYRWEKMISRYDVLF